MKKILFLALFGLLSGCAATPFMPVQVDCRVKIGYDHQSGTAKYAYCL